MSELNTQIVDTILNIARRRSAGLAEVRMDQALVADIGLESLDIAELVATLELRLGKDPFAADVAITSVRTVGDLCRAYGGG